MGQFGLAEFLLILVLWRQSQGSGRENRNERSARPHRDRGPQVGPVGRAFQPQVDLCRPFGPRLPGNPQALCKSVDLLRTGPDLRAGKPEKRGLATAVL